MAISFNPLTVLSGFNLTSINSNFQSIKTALLDGLSRSGQTPNQMNADIDMNSNDIINIKNFLLVAPSEFADDASAAAGGVLVGGLYRTGSIVKVRVA